MRLKNSFEILELDDQFIAVPINKSEGEFQGILKLNSSAREILELLNENTTEEEMCLNLNHKYPGQEEDIKQFVKDIVLKLREAGLVVE